MFAVRSKNIVNLYDVKIDYEKLKKLRDDIKQNCSIIIEKTISMDTDVSYNEDFIILSSTIEEKTEDGIIYSNLCQYRIVPRVINLIDKLIETNDLGLISNIYESLNEDVENKLKAEDLLGKYIKLLKKVNNPAYQNIKDLVMYRYNEKLIKGADCKAIAYKRELDRCFNVKTSVVYATDNELYKLMDEKEIYVILPENEVFSFTEELTNNKVIKRVLKCK